MLVSCNDCLKHKIPTLESIESDYYLRINFHVYKPFTIHSKHGIIGLGNLICEICSNFDCDEE